MIFQYNELKDSIEDDFERFSKWGFNEKQIFPAVMDEYKYGEDFSQIENICIHVFLILFYRKNAMTYDFILIELNKLVLLVGQDAIKNDLGKDFDEFIADYNTIKYA